MIALFPAVDPRVRWLRGVLVAAALSGMLFCRPLWLSTRDYPLVPLLPSWLILPASYGPVLLALTLFSLVAAAWYFRPAIIFFLAATLYLYGCDQNRGQPWMYMYWVMLLLNLLPERTVLPACRLALSLVYFWAGVQKLNGTFFSVMPPWFVQPASDWGLPGMVVAALRWVVTMTPFMEIFISIGVWFRKTRWYVIALATTLHGASLLFLGPIGHDVNVVVWPWNIAMVALLVVLFGLKERASLMQALGEVRKSIVGAVVIALYGLLPILSFFGWWDSYFSFSLYSANLSKADLYLSRPFLERLPAQLQTYVYPTKNFNPSFQAPFILEHQMWAAAKLGVPPLPEPRGYAVVFRQIAAYATNDDDCWMYVQTRGGNVLLYRPGAANPLIINK